MTLSVSWLLRFMATLSSTLLFPFLFVFQILGSKQPQEVVEISIFKFIFNLGWVPSYEDSSFLFWIEVYGIVLLAFLAFNFILLWLLRKIVLGWYKDAAEHNSGLKIEEIGIANSHFFGFYLAFFFVAFSIPPQNYPLAFACYLLLFTLSFISNDYYFNPVLLLNGYHFYSVKTISGVKLSVITKEKLRTPKDFNAQSDKSYIRINSFTLWEI